MISIDVKLFSDINSEETLVFNLQCLFRQQNLVVYQNENLYSQRRLHKLISR